MSKLPNAEPPTAQGMTAAHSIETVDAGPAPESLFVAADIVDKYDVLEKLGEGGMGEVHKAQQRGVNRLVDRHRDTKKEICPASSRTKKQPQTDSGGWRAPEEEGP